MNQLITLFMALIRSEVLGEALDAELANKITPEMLPKLYNIAKNHNLIHLISYALERQGLLEDEKIAEPFLKGVFQAVKKHDRTKSARKNMYELFEKKGIPFVPLKGTVLENLYPTAWMRTRCDTDILVREEDLQQAKDSLVAALDYEVKEEKYHDIWLRSPEKADLELHFSLLEHNEKLDKVLQRAWDYIVPAREGSYEQKMLPEFFMFHLLAHMAYHFSKGGCGIRSIVDIWLLERQGGYDEAKLSALCEEAGILTFAQYVFQLADIWFEGGEHDDTSRLVERYIISNGTYGSQESKVMATRMEKKGRLRYLWGRMFLPREDLSIIFPSLKEKPYLYVYYSVRHWGKVVKKKKGKAILREVKLNHQMKKENVEKLQDLFENLGL